MKDKYKVLVVEDEPFQRLIFSQWLNNSSSYECVMEITNASVADLFVLKNPSLDLVLMDVVTENAESGLLASKKIRRFNKDIKIIISTSMPEYSYIDTAKSIPVDGFWYKNASEKDFFKTLNDVMAGKKIFPETSKEIKLGLASSSEFTSRELLIIRYLTEGYSNREIADKIGNSPGVIKNHIADLLIKTGFRSRTQLAVRARESGLVIVERHKREES